LTEQNAVPLIVLSASRDPVEAINSVLRRAGHPVHCTWIPDLRDLADALAQINPELLIHVAAEGSDLKATLSVRDQIAPIVPAIVLTDTANPAPVTESMIVAAMQAGARDVVSLANPERLHAIAAREIRAFRIERALRTSVQSAHDARSQLESVLQRSNDAIIQVQEGIVVDANPAWLELVGNPEGLIGQPVMDLFDEASQAALKGALAACTQGRWSDHTLKIGALLAEGSVLPVEVVLALGEYEGEPGVRLVVPARPRDEHKLAADVDEAIRSDASTGFLHRRQLLEALARRMATPAPGGMRHLALLRIDKFSSLERDVGVTASEDIIVDFARLLRETLHPKEIIGRLGGVRFLVLLERGNERDIEAWSEQFLTQLRKHTTRVKDKALSISCTIGLTVVSHGQTNLDALVADAAEACKRGTDRGGNQSVLSDRADADTRVQSYDKVWVKHIKAALMENRFRLVQQPVASLQGEDPVMFDVLVRMVDGGGREVLPSEFMAAAERNDLMKNIDRWVVGASLSFAAQRKPGCLFVRLSRDTLTDATFDGWLDNHTRSTRAEPDRLCFQVTESLASSYLPQVRTRAAALRQRGFRFAIDGFGSGRDSQGLLDAVPLDFVKIDGALVQSLATDAQLQKRIRLLVEAATKRRVQTIAERVENANTMAVLWQIGVQYIQGYFINEPEQVVLGAAR